MYSVTQEQSQTKYKYNLVIDETMKYEKYINGLNTQVLAFQKSWRSFSPITVCIIAQCQCRTGGEAGGTCPYPPRRGRGECPKKFPRIFMYGNGLVVFGVVWGGLGYFEAVGFQKEI